MTRSSPVGWQRGDVVPFTLLSSTYLCSSIYSFLDSSQIRKLPRHICIWFVCSFLFFSMMSLSNTSYLLAHKNRNSYLLRTAYYRGLSMDEVGCARRWRWSGGRRGWACFRPSQPSGRVRRAHGDLEERPGLDGQDP